jgi:hypothetical protein
LGRGERQKQEAGREQRQLEAGRVKGALKLGGEGKIGVRSEEEGTGGSEGVAAWGVTEAVAHSAIWSIHSSSGSIPLAVVVEAAAIGAAGVSFTVGGSGLVAGGVTGPRGG